MEKNTNTELQRNFALPGDAVTRRVPHTAWLGVLPVGLHRKAEVRHA
jgi:hypothetical protein